VERRLQPEQDRPTRLSTADTLDDLGEEGNRTKIGRKGAHAPLRQVLYNWVKATFLQGTIERTKLIGSRSTKGGNIATGSRM